MRESQFKFTVSVSIQPKQGTFYKPTYKIAALLIFKALSREFKLYSFIYFVFSRKNKKFDFLSKFHH